MAEAGAFDPDHDLAALRCRRGDFIDNQASTVGVQACSFPIRPTFQITELPSCGDDHVGGHRAGDFNGFRR
jgi:hypothetical protein